MCRFLTKSHIYLAEYVLSAALVNKYKPDKPLFSCETTYKGYGSRHFVCACYQNARVLHWKLKSFEALSRRTVFSRPHEGLFEKTYYLIIH